MGGGEAGDEDAVGGAGDVVEAGLVAEFDGGGVAAVFAADADFEVCLDGAPFFDGDLDEGADAFAVEFDEGVLGEDVVLEVGGEEAAGVVTGEAEGGLGEVVGAEGEEVGVVGDVGGGEAGAGEFDHGADGVFDALAAFGEDGFGDGFDAPRGRFGVRCRGRRGGS